MRAMGARLFASPAAEPRLEAARAWLRGRKEGEEVVLIAPTPEAGHALVRSTAAEGRAAFGWYRTTLGRLAAELATPVLVEQGLAHVGRLASEAVLARVLHELRPTGALGRFAPVATGPGLARALASVLLELRFARVPDEKLPTELLAVARAFDARLAEVGLADRSRVFDVAAAQAREMLPPSPLVGMPLALLDLPVTSACERELIAALAARAPDVFATVPAADRVSSENLLSALGVSALESSAELGARALGRLQSRLFQGQGESDVADLDESVVVLSAPGESRECVEIARRVIELAGQGVPFDRMAVLLRSPQEYRAHLEEAFGRARIGAWFARGNLRPDPSGRAFFALIACAAEELSARRFAEYLSLGELPNATQEGAPPPSLPDAERWVAPDDEMLADALAEAQGETLREASSPAPPEAARRPLPVEQGSLRSPRRWEQLILDSAVIGGLERWERRLAAFDKRLEAEIGALEDPDGPSGERRRKSRAELEALRGFALPLLAELDALPASATWREWIDALSSLATRSLRRPDRVLAVLSELVPMGDVGPVELPEVQLVLSERLLELTEPPLASPAGRVFVGTAAAARGLSFDVVFVPGLAERLFPRKIVEEPILLDAARAELDAGLRTTQDRVGEERLLLHLAVGAARDRLFLSYPRLDMDQGRPRVPSFYALEAVRAAEGRLPGFDELAARAETLSQTRVGWPAPARPMQAIDDAEHDLALLESLLESEQEAVGTARYLLHANPHLARALRFRARRWLKSWTVADGIVKPSDAARVAMRDHALEARAFSPTALQNYTACPYRFYLYAIMRLEPREVPERIEELNPLQRGSLVHDTQFELYTALNDRGLLPVTRDNLMEVRDVLDEQLDAVEAAAREDLDPAIDRVWVDGIETIRADMREWLRLVSEEGEGFTPWRFELSFGLPKREKADDDSRPDPVQLESGLQLRGAIDLIERRVDGVLRVTDHKTGKVRFGADSIVEGGKALQPVLYALAVEKLFPDAEVSCGRLYYCTADGGFETRDVVFDERAKESARIVVDAVRAGLSEPFLPAAPAKDACRWCDYRIVCGPYEESRTRLKRADALSQLKGVRKLP